MTDVVNEYRHLDAMDVADLHGRYDTLKNSLHLLPSGMPDPNAEQDDATLREMCVVLTILRKRSAGPPKKKSGGRAKSSTIAAAPSIDEL